MALKIPQAPGIRETENVLRSPQVVSPVTEAPKFSVDLSALKDSIGDVTGYFKEKARQEETTLTTAGKNEYIQHMTSFINNVYQNNQGSKARDLYVQYIKPESDKWLKDYFSGPKDDGKIRMASPELQKQFSSWVETQQPSYITSAAHYEQREWDKYSESVHQAQDNIAATTILNAESDITINNGINLFRQNTYDANPGMDKDFIEQAIAKKVDSSLLSNINRKSEESPIAAYDRLMNEDISKYMSTDSQQKALESIRKSYINIASTEYAQGVSYGMTQNRNAIAKIFDCQTKEDIDTIQSQILKKANEKREALEKDTRGMQDQMMNNAMDTLLTASTRDQFIQGAQNVYSVNPDAGVVLMENYNKMQALQNDIDNLGMFYEDVITDLNTEINNIVPELSETGGLPGGETVGLVFGRTGEVLHEFASSVKDIYLGTPEKIATDDKIQQAADTLVSQGRISPEQAAAAVRIRQHAESLKANMNEYKDLTARISSGEIRAYNVDLMGHLPPEMQRQLALDIKTQNKFYDTKNALDAAGVDLDKVIQDSGADAQYKYLGAASKNMLKRAIVAGVNDYKLTHQGNLPGTDALNGIVYKAQLNSMSPEDTALQQIARDQNLSKEDLTDAQRYELSVYSVVNNDYLKPSKRGLKDEYTRSSQSIDKLAGHAMLDREERLFIKMNKQYLTRLLQAGDLAGISSFIGLARKGGF